MQPNIYEEIYIPFQLFKFVGLTSFAIERNSEGCRRLVSRKVDIVIRALLVLFILVSNVIFWTGRLEPNILNSLHQLFFYTVAAFTSAGTIVMITTGLIQNQQLQLVINQINEFDTKIYQTSQMQFYYRKSNSNKITLVKLLLLLLLMVFNSSNTDVGASTLTIADIITYYYFYFMLLVSASLYCCLILGCCNRIKFTNDYIEKLLFGNETVACIETKLTPVANICYKLEDVKTELCGLIDTVEDINRYFEVQMFIKTTNLFLNFLWSTYFFADSTGERFELPLSLRHNYFVLIWIFVGIVDFCIEVHIYQRLLAEVSKKVIKNVDADINFVLKR